MKTNQRLSITVGAMLAILLQPLGCSSWQVQRGTPQEVLARTPTTAMIVDADDQSWTLHDPTLVDDSIVGEVVWHLSWGDSLTRVAIPTTNIKQIKVYGFDPVLTGWFVVGMGVTAFLIARVTREGSRKIRVRLPDSLLTSCPVVYSWDGHRWRRDSGTFGGAIASVLSRTDVDNLDFAAPSNGELRLRVTNELDETDHIDAISVLAVDHDPGVAVAPDPHGNLHTILSSEPPIEARDFAGRDVLERIQTSDGWGWESALNVRDTMTQVRDGVVLTFHRSSAARAGKLVLDANNTPWAASMLEAFISAHGSATQAWYDSLSTYPAIARATQGALAREAFLTVYVWKQGKWVSQGVAWEAGPEAVKRQVIPLDLRGVSGDSISVRLESIPGFWNIDHVALDLSPDRPVRVARVRAYRAVDETGRDVSSLIGRIDGQEYVTETGDAAELSFRVPDVPTGMARSYVLQSTGWYHVHTPESEAPQVALLSRIGREPDALSRMATARLNAAVLAAQKEVGPLERATTQVQRHD